MKFYVINTDYVPDSIDIYLMDNENFKAEALRQEAEEGFDQRVFDTVDDFVKAFNNETVSTSTDILRIMQ